MAYVDGFVIAVPKKNMGTYRTMARWGKKTWMKYGALEYYECLGDDLKVKAGCGIPFTKLAKTRKDEAVVFAFIVYKSRKQRDAINKKVMSDPSMKAMSSMKMPFKMDRFSYGGFKSFVEARRKVTSRGRRR
jgi:alkaline phosphatase